MNEKRIRVKDLTPMIQCKLCRGCIVEATTITECLHTFCKSCLVKYLQKERRCPKCDELIHQSHPLDYISLDPTFQEIVTKIFPNLKNEEEERERQFYVQNPREKNPRAPVERRAESSSSARVSLPSPHEASDYHRKDEQYSVQLECRSAGLRPLKRRYLRCSSHSTVLLLKKFIAAELFDDITRCNELDIVCNDELLGRDHTLKFVALTLWRFRDPPLVLHYRQRLELTM